jgi:hypothetical protein
MGVRLSNSSDHFWVVILITMRWNIKSANFSGAIAFLDIRKDLFAIWRFFLKIPLFKWKYP